MTALIFDFEVKSPSFKIILKLQFVAANHVKSLILTNDVVSLEVLHKSAISHLRKGHLEVRSFSAPHVTSGHTSEGQITFLQLPFPSHSQDDQQTTIWRANCQHYQENSSIFV